MAKYGGQMQYIYREPDHILQERWAPFWIVALRNLDSMKIGKKYSNFILLLLSEIPSSDSTGSTQLVPLLDINMLFTDKAKYSPM